MPIEPVTYSFTWNKIEIIVEYKPKTFSAFENVYGTPLSHLLIKCPHQLPITKAGYYIRQDLLMEHGGPLEYLKTWLDETAHKSGWKVPAYQSCQLSLF